ncbi:hypothetical protein LXA43DRAFT_1066832 [Ganoderma leucocontextum]|nr:hypothetical protein LXA43DRAFT_1066832 [Ganoderma leucocontextum]
MAPSSWMMTWGTKLPRLLKDDHICNDLQTSSMCASLTRNPTGREAAKRAPQAWKDIKPRSRGGSSGNKLPTKKVLGPKTTAAPAKEKVNAKVNMTQALKKGSRYSPPSMQLDTSDDNDGEPPAARKASGLEGRTNSQDSNEEDSGEGKPGEGEPSNSQEEAENLKDEYDNDGEEEETDTELKGLEHKPGMLERTFQQEVHSA